MTRRLSWKTIRERHPRQWVLLQKVMWPAGSPEPKTGIVVVHGRSQELLVTAREKVKGSVVVWTGKVPRVMHQLRGTKAKETTPPPPARTAPDEGSKQRREPIAWRDHFLPRITTNPDFYGGKPIIRGRRLAVEHVLAMISGGSTFGDILAAYPWLERADLRACLMFAQEAIRKLPATPSRGEE